MSSKMGWIVAVIIVVLVGGVIGYVVLHPSTSDPTEDTTAPGAMDFHEVAIPITTIVPAEPAGAGNAAEDYQKAVEIIKPIFEKALADNPSYPHIFDKAVADIGTWMKPKEGKAENRPVNPEELAVMEKIAGIVAQGAAKKEMKYPLDLEKMDVTYNLPEAKYLHEVSQVLSDYAHYQHLVLNKPEEAQKIIFNRFIMGWHMTHDRVYPSFVLAGFEIQSSSCYWLGGDESSLYPNWPGHERQTEQVRAYMSASNEVIAFFNNKSKFMFSKFARANDPPNPGDIFNVVENDKDPSWRVQGILVMGMLKYSPGLLNSEHVNGDTKCRRRLLDDKLKSGTEEEKAAAKAADRYTQEDYDNQGTKNAAY